MRTPNWCTLGAMVDKDKLAEARRRAEARDYGATARLARELLEQSPDDVVTLDLLGYALYFLGQLEEAESVCRRTLELSPEHAYAFKGLGLCLAKRGRIDDGVTALERAIALKPKWFDPYWDLSVSLVEARRYGAVFEVLRRAREALPDRATEWDKMEKHARAAGARAR
ncbi:MAG TPA: tetratricopeptide repeat protein [Polyangiaceae bacterium]|nr:tetratricopeptide repeat protein [Polyangiaceae bacterium]